MLQSSKPAVPSERLVYIDNQSIGKDVWFDDLVIDHYESEVVAEDHYYPFGLTLAQALMTVGVTEQPYKLTTNDSLTKMIQPFISEKFLKGNFPKR